MTKKQMYSVALIVVVLIVAVFFASMKSRGPATTTGGKIKPITTVVYMCSGNKTITAAYLPGTTIPAASAGMPPTPGGSVQLVLDDGRTMTLPQTISADGARYANADESFVFWNKGSGVMVLENGAAENYANCVINS